MNVGGLGWEAGSKPSSCYIIASASLFILLASFYRMFMQSSPTSEKTMGLRLTPIVSKLDNRE